MCVWGEGLMFKGKGKKKQKLQSLMGNSAHPFSVGMVFLLSPKKRESLFL